MVLIRFVLAVALAAALGLASPATAHENHQREQAEQAAAVRASASGVVPDNIPHMPEHIEATEDQRPTTLSGRLVRFLGAMHPFAVHFPIALIPASWLALVLARRRGHAVDVIRAVIILAGIAAVSAALFGWFNAGFVLADEDSIQTYHRWIGTALAIIVGAIGICAWRQTESVNSRAMTWVLGATTLLLLAQGWLGATITHGIEHMSF
ncbi:MAG: DUF2231 domain-containing protein [Sphingosinicella sp.]